MKSNKQDIIDFLINNEATVHDIITKTNEHIKDVEVEFMDIAKSQQFEEIKKQVMDELSKSMSLTIEDICTNVDDEELEKYFAEIKKL